jgi:hypothetical protein
MYNIFICRDLKWYLAKSMEPSPCWDANNCFANQDILLFYEPAKDYRSLIHILTK